MRDVLGLFPKLAAVTRSHLRHGDFTTLDLAATALRLDVPALFFHGANDRAVPIELTRRYVERLDALAGKHLVTLPTSAHFFSDADAPSKPSSSTAGHTTPRPRASVGSPPF